MKTFYYTVDHPNDRSSCPVAKIYAKDKAQARKRIADKYWDEQAERFYSSGCKINFKTEEEYVD